MTVLKILCLKRLSLIFPRLPLWIVQRLECFFGRYKKILRLGGSAEMTNGSDDLKRIFLMSGIFKIIPMKEEEKLNG